MQSYGSVIMRGKLDIYQMRIFMGIVKRANNIIPSMPLKEIIRRGIDTSHVTRIMSMPIKEIIGSSHNYGPVKDAIRHLKAWQVEYYDKPKGLWQLASIMEDVVLDERGGVVTFKTQQWVLDYILDFKNGGARIYDYVTAMSMASAYSARMYMLTCNMGKPLTYKISDLKEILGVGEKYKRFSDFEKRVLKKSIADMQKKGADYYKYTIIRKYKDKPKSEPQYITITPVKAKVSTEKIGEVVAKIKGSVGEQIFSYMVSSVGFSNREMSGNRQMFECLPKKPGWQEKLFEIVERARRKNKNHGYIINGLKKWLAEK